MLEKFFLQFDPNRIFRRFSRVRKRNIYPGGFSLFTKSAGKEQFFTLKDWTVENLADFISAKASGTDHCWLMEAGTPFVEKRAAEKLWKIHSEYFAEYTFADGYPGGLFPVVAATGILPSIKEIAKNDKTSPGKDFLFICLYR